MKLSVITPTHDPRYLAETWLSLRDQTHEDFEWVIVANGEKPRELAWAVAKLIDGDIRVRVVEHEPFTGVGAAKKFAFGLGTGDALVELDHDDLLLPDALAEVSAAFESNPSVGFVYSDSADFQNGAVGQGDVTYLRDDTRPGWVANGFKFYSAELGGVRPGTYEAVHAFAPTAIALSTIFWAPNHVRAWRRSVYEQLGGHSEGYAVCDDHELMLRTYLVTKMTHIPKPLYLYRVTGDNTWLKNVGVIGNITWDLHRQYAERLVLRECELLGMPAYDVGGGIDLRAGWQSVDKREGSHVVADLSQRWPFEDNSVGAFRASDFLEHLPDKMHTLRELHRCLRPGGWLMSSTPSTDGRGAFQDPTHVSYWNQNAFWYVTRAAQARYIDNVDVRFQEIQLSTGFPSPWHEENKISYVTANLIALKSGYDGPAERHI